MVIEITPLQSSTAGRLQGQTDRSPLIAVEDLHVHFQLGRHDVLRAVNGVSFDVNAGEVFGIIGESGSGKSTVARVLVGLLNPTEGTVLHDGVVLAKLRSREFRSVRRGYQIVFQDPEGALNPRMTVLQSVREPLDIAGVGSSQDRNQAAMTCLEQVGLGSDFAGRYPHQLSGGQKQRVNIARVLTMQPKLVVCDEAVAALDVSIQAEIINLFSELKYRLGLTYVFISHDLNVVAHISDRVAVMYLGRLVEVSPVEQLLASPMHPYTQALLRSRPSPVPASLREKRQPALTGEIPNAISYPDGCAFQSRCPQATALCAAEVPVWRSAESGHWVACHFAGQNQKTQSK
ncbi:ABC transporter ATP-binding protein [Bradyrhizobium iriomotense]|nr:ABC transporter ATP-binding protein [Bradyrhizobium iriomotense]